MAPAELEAGKRIEVAAYITDSLIALVLEIGCFTGFSALGWAEAVKDMPDAKVSNNHDLTMDIWMTANLPRDNHFLSSTDALVCRW